MKFIQKLGKQNKVHSDESEEDVAVHPQKSISSDEEWF